MPLVGEGVMHWFRKSVYVNSIVAHAERLSALLPFNQHKIGCAPDLVSATNHPAFDQLIQLPLNPLFTSLPVITGLMVDGDMRWHINVEPMVMYTPSVMLRARNMRFKL